MANHICHIETSQKKNIPQRHKDTEKKSEMLNQVPHQSL